MSWLQLERIQQLGTNCPVCKKSDWCLGGDTAVVCARIARCQLKSCRYCRSGRPRRYGGAGWIHLTRTAPSRFRCRSSHCRVADTRGFCNLHSRCREDIEPRQIDWLGNQLSVSSDALRRLEIGWLEPRGFTFPVRSPNGSIVGLSVRSVKGNKNAVRGSASGQGLFIPTGLDTTRAIFVPEGASDVAALLTQGLQAVGRVSLGTPNEIVQRYLSKHGFHHIIVVADNDPHEAGQRAATELAQYLAHFRCRTYLLIPPCKDVRGWIKSGATVTEIRQRIQYVT